MTLEQFVAAVFARVEPLLPAPVDVDHPRVERRRKLAEKLDADECPHAFVFSPDLAADQLDDQVEAATYLVRVAFVTHAQGQTVTLAYLAALQASLRADPTLGGVAQVAYVAAASLRESYETERAELTVIVAGRSED